MSTRALMAGLLLAAIVPGAGAQDVAWTANWRNRIESVSRDDFARDALAPTSRLRLALQSGEPAEAWQWCVEAEGVLAIGDHFDSGANGESSYPSVTDPTSAEINQAWIGWRQPAWRVLAGRQRLLFGNQRFIGNSGWRQNEQTFDAISADGKLSGFAWRYAWLDRVHRVASDRALSPAAREHDLDAHAAHASLATKAGDVSAYGYFLDDRTRPAASTRTLGVRYESPKTRALRVVAEAARQDDHAGAPREFRHGYYLLELGGGATTRWALGEERLQGDGRSAFQTPLATLHAFNGWADLFTTTPAAGLRDRYASLGGRHARSKIAWTLAWHQFRADRGNADFGDEWDASATRDMGAGWSALAKVAAASGVTKLWVQLEWVH